VRPRGVFLSWVSSHGRSHDLARALGLQEVNYPRWVVTQPRAVRYLVAAVSNVWALVRTRPAAVMVMSPPPFPVLIAAAYCLVTRRPLVVDAHSGAFNRPAWRALSRLSLRLAQRCPRAAVVVTNDEMRAEAQGWVRMPVIQLHDLLAPPAAPVEERSCDVFFVSTWADDEPLGTLAAAMAELAGLHVVISGRPPSDGARQELELAGVHVPGFLSDEDYRRMFGGAGVIVALTTRDGTMQRGGYEAASAGKALVTSDTRVLRDYFGPAALYTADDPSALASAVRDALARQMELEGAIRALRDRLLIDQDVGLRQLADVLRSELLRAPGLD
jgi:glycosyltransferase involved in cell wall biosynthesis